MVALVVVVIEVAVVVAVFVMLVVVVVEKVAMVVMSVVHGVGGVCCGYIGAESADDGRTVIFQLSSMHSPKLKCPFFYFSLLSHCLSHFTQYLSRMLIS